MTGKKNNLTIRLEYQVIMCAMVITRRERDRTRRWMYVWCKKERGSAISQHSRDLLNAEFGCDAPPRRVASGLLAVCAKYEHTIVLVCVLDFWRCGVIGCVEATFFSFTSYGLVLILANTGNKIGVSLLFTNILVYFFKISF